MLKRIHRDQKGFTLVELLVVVAIIGALMAVAVAALTGFIGAGKEGGMTSEKVAVQTALDAWMAQTLTDNITTPRTVAAAITPTDTDAPFKMYLRQIPTTYLYTWTSDGEVTVTAP